MHILQDTQNTKQHVSEQPCSKSNIQLSSKDGYIKKKSHRKQNI